MPETTTVPTCPHLPPELSEAFDYIMYAVSDWTPDIGGLPESEREGAMERYVANRNLVQQHLGRLTLTPLSCCDGVEKLDEAGKIITADTEMPVCPHCGKANCDYLDIRNGERGLHEQEMTCDFCDGLFIVSCNVETSYTTRKLG